MTSQSVRVPKGVVVRDMTEALQARSRVADAAIDMSIASDRANKREIMALLEPRPNGTLLDVGCDSGAFTLEVARATGATYLHGIEIVEPAAAAAREAGIEVVQADINAGLPYGDATFDIIIANQVIEHLYFTDDFAQELRRVIKPDGYIIISTTNLAALHYRVWLLFGMQPSCLHPSEHQFGNHLKGVANPRYGHKSVFTYRAFLGFLAFHGFEVERALSSGLHPFSESISRPILRVMPSIGIFTTVKARPKGSSV